MTTAWPFCSSYHKLFWDHTDQSLRSVADTLATGEDILFNCVVGHVSKAAPLLLATASANSNRHSISNEGHRYASAMPPPASRVSQHRDTCLRAFANHFEPQEVLVYADPDAGRKFGLVKGINATSYLPLFTTNLRCEALTFLLHRFRRINRLISCFVTPDLFQHAIQK